MLKVKESRLVQYLKNLLSACITISDCVCRPDLVFVSLSQCLSACLSACQPVSVSVSLF